MTLMRRGGRMLPSSSLPLVLLLGVVLLLQLGVLVAGDTCEDQVMNCPGCPDGSDPDCVPCEFGVDCGGPCPNPCDPCEGGTKCGTEDENCVSCFNGCKDGQFIPSFLPSLIPSPLFFSLVAVIAVPVLSSFGLFHSLSGLEKQSCSFIFLLSKFSLSPTVLFVDFFFPVFLIPSIHSFLLPLALLCSALLSLLIHTRQVTRRESTAVVTVSEP